jgi:hypothetical protein
VVRVMMPVVRRTWCWSDAVAGTARCRCDGDGDAGRSHVNVLRIRDNVDEHQFRLRVSSGVRAPDAPPRRCGDGGQRRGPRALRRWV